MPTKKSTATGATSARAYQLKISLKYIEPPIWRRVQVPASITLGDLHYIIQIVMGWEGEHMHEFTIKKVNYGPPEPDYGMPFIFLGTQEQIAAPAAVLDEVEDEDDEDEDEWEDDWTDDYGTKNEDKVKLNEVVTRVRTKFKYLYDFGDSWQHEIEVEKILPPEPGVHYPICLAGERAGPPEDIGGVWGYANMLEVLADPNHPDREEMLDWPGGIEIFLVDEDAESGEEATEVSGDDNDGEEDEAEEDSEDEDYIFDPEKFDIEALNQRLARMQLS
jgi:Plasmid pRiA4b ORF-3-like protein